MKIREILKISRQALGKTMSPFSFHGSILLTQPFNSAHLLYQHYFPALKYDWYHFQDLNLPEVSFGHCSPHFTSMFSVGPSSWSFCAFPLTLWPFFSATSVSWDALGVVKFSRAGVWGSTGINSRLLNIKECLFLKLKPPNSFREYEQNTMEEV